MQLAMIYLGAIEEVNRAERRMERSNDAKSKRQLQSATDAAIAAWRSMPPELRNKLEPPPPPL